MAKENYIYLIGQIKKPVAIKYDTDNNPIKAQFVLTTIKRSIYDNAGMYTPKFDYLYIESQNQEIINVCSKIKQFDFIEVKGTVATKNVTRGKICPQCGHTILQKGVLDYIEPIYIGIRAHANSGTDGVKYLRACAEASNILKVIGVVCQEPEFYIYDNGVEYAHYNIAINRKLFVEGQPEISADFPWVKTYGEQAAKDKIAIRKGSLIYIDGYLKSEKAKQQTTCDACGCTFDFEHVVTVIRPFSVEYLEGCRLPEPDKAIASAKTYEEGNIV